MSHEIRCHHCHHWVGESSRPMTWIGNAKHPKLRTQFPGPRNTWYCKSCGRCSVFVETVTTGGDWRMVEVKRSA